MTVVSTYSPHPLSFLDYLTELVELPKLSKARLSRCWVEQKCPLTKDGKPAFQTDTQDGSSSYLIVLVHIWVSYECWHHALISLFLGSWWWHRRSLVSHYLSESMLNQQSTKPQWCQRGGYHGPGTMLGCQKINGQHGWMVHWSA